MPRTDRLELKLTPEERAKIDAAAESEGESVSHWVRRAVREALLRSAARESGILPPRKARRA